MQVTELSLVKLLWIKVKFVFIRKICPGLLYLVFAVLPRKKNQVLIIKADGIGDYVLFRNYLHFLKQSQKYRHCRLEMVVNMANKSLSQHFDSDVVEKFFYYSESYFLKWDMIRLLWQLQLGRFETIIYPNYSRSFQIDWLIGNVSASNKIGVDGDCINESEKLKQKGNKCYSELINPGFLPVHEFERNKQVFEDITSEKCFFSRPIIEKNKCAIIHTGAIVIFPDASSENKKWPVERFYALCGRIYRELGAKMIVVPGKGEALKGNFWGLDIPEDFIRVAGDLDMVAVCGLIGGAALLISGDTVAVHVAAALAVPAVCVCKGDLYGRFIPYPPDVADRMYCVLPGNMEPANFRHDQWSPAKIEDVEVSDVFDAVTSAWTMKKVV